MRSSCGGIGSGSFFFDILLEMIGKFSATWNVTRDAMDNTTKPRKDNKLGKEVAARLSTNRS